MEIFLDKTAQAQTCIYKENIAGGTEMLEKLKDLLSKVVPDVDMANVNEDTRLSEDLGFDSLALLMLSMEIEDAFKFKFTEFVRFETVGDVCRYLEEKIK